MKIRPDKKIVEIRELGVCGDALKLFQLGLKDRHTGEVLYCSKLFKSKDEINELLNYFMQQQILWVERKPKPATVNV